MKAQTLVFSLFCIIFIQHSMSLSSSSKKYKRTMIEGGTWNSMQIRTHSDKEARGLVYSVHRVDIVLEIEQWTAL